MYVIRSPLSCQYGHNYSTTLSKKMNFLLFKLYLTNILVIINIIVNCDYIPGTHYNCINNKSEIIRVFEIQYENPGFCYKFRFRIVLKNLVYNTKKINLMKQNCFMIKKNCLSTVLYLTTLYIKIYFIILKIVQRATTTFFYIKTYT